MRYSDWDIDVLKVGYDEVTGLVCSVGSSKVYIDVNLDGSLDGVSLGW